MKANWAMPRSYPVASHELAQADRVRDRRKGIAEAKEGQVNPMQEAPEPPADGQLALRAGITQRAYIFERVPDTDAELVAVERGDRAAERAVVDKECKVDARALHQLVRGSEAVIAFDQLQAAIANVPLELDAAKPTKPDSFEEAEPDLRGLLAPHADLIASEAEAHRVLAQLLLREVEERFAPFVEVAVVRHVLVFWPWDDLGREHLDIQRHGDREGGFELGAVACHDDLADAAVPRKDVRVERLERAGKPKRLGRDLQVCRYADGHRARSVNAGGVGQLVGAVFVEHAKQHIVVGFHRQVAQLHELAASASDELQRFVVARQEDCAPWTHSSEPVEPALLNPITRKLRPRRAVARVANGFQL